MYCRQKFISGRVIAKDLLVHITPIDVVNMLLVGLFGAFWVLKLQAIPLSFFRKVFKEISVPTLILTPITAFYPILSISPQNLFLPLLKT